MRPSDIMKGMDKQPSPQGNANTKPEIIQPEKSPGEYAIFEMTLLPEDMKILNEAKSVFYAYRVNANKQRRSFKVIKGPEVAEFVSAIKEKEKAALPTSPQLAIGVHSHESPNVDLNPILNRATEAIGDRDEALRWLGTPVRGLGYATPISLLGTKAGAQSVEDILVRIEHGTW
jgi:hypothetical protein